MTDLERYEPHTAVDHRNTLDSTGPMENAWRLAQRIAATEFVPKGLRGSPEKVLAALLLGHEKGVGAMTALQHIDVIEGKATANAALKQAQAEAAGARFRVVEFTAARCTVHAWAPGDTGDPTVVTWTIDDARAAKLTGKDNWQKYPRKMLFRRAMSDACDLVAAAAVVGLPPSADELPDDSPRYLADVPAAAVHRPVTAAELTGPAPEPAAAEVVEIIDDAEPWGLVVPERAEAEQTQPAGEVAATLATLEQPAGPAAAARRRVADR